jgi:hypothetical protein
MAASKRDPNDANPINDRHCEQITVYTPLADLEVLSTDIRTGSGDIQFDPTDPVVNQGVASSATIHNSGQMTINNFSVAFYVVGELVSEAVDAGAGVEEIGTIQMVDYQLEPGGTYIAQPKDENGNRILWSSPQTGMVELLGDGTQTCFDISMAFAIS